MAVRTETEGLRKKQIMQATRDVISEKGLDRTTMRDIGQRAGMSAAIVCYYFDDKKRLMKETLLDASTSHRSTLDAIINSSQPPLEKLDAAIRDSLPISGDQQREWRLWLDYWAEAARDPDLRAAISESEARFRGFLESIIREGAGDVFRSDIDPAQLAMAAVGILEGLAMAYIMDPLRVDLDTAISLVKRIVLPC